MTKSPNPYAVMKTALRVRYPHIKGRLRLRYAGLLVARAVRLYIEGKLDSGVVGEDLPGGCGTGGYDLGNLEYSENLEKRYARDFKKL